MHPNEPEAPTPPAHRDQEVKNGRNYPTPLDALFIILVAGTLLLFLLWVLYGGDTKYSNAPGFIVDIAKSVWAKISFASGSAGALLLRKFTEDRPFPNYLIWIPSVLGMMIAALFLLRLTLPPPPVQAVLPAPVQARMHVSFGLDTNPDVFALFHKEPQAPDFKLWETLPDSIDAHGVYYNSANPSFPYRDTLNVKQGGKSQAYIELASTQGDNRGTEKKFDYKICLQPSPKPPSSNNNGPGIVLGCAKGVCSPAKDDDPGYVVGVDCDAKAENSGGILPVVLADEQSQQTREPGWKVPSVTTLQKMTDQLRPGYTVFDVSFTPQGQAARALKYYFALRVNDQPVYIDGLSPGLEKQPLQHDAVNHIGFGLENLNFTGQHEGHEKLHLSVFFLAGDALVFRQDLDREYIALRPAAEIPPIQTAVGTFQWTGKYFAPRNKNKYEVILASSACGEPPRKDCVDRTMYVKDKFDKSGAKFNEQPIVMVVRPPLRKLEAYGLSFGLVQPTGQVQFTFDEAEAGQACQWAADNAGKGVAGRYIRQDATRYDVESKNYKHCH